MNHISRRTCCCVFFAMVLSLALLGCDDGGQPEPRFQLSPEQARNWSYFDLAEAFGRDLVDGEPDDAWELMSQRYRQSTAHEAFTQELRDIVKKYGQPVEVKADDLRTGEVLHGNLSGFDRSVPDTMRAARVGLQLAVQISPNAPMHFERWYYCWIYIVDEGEEKYAIDGFEFVEPVMPGLGE